MQISDMLYNNSGQYGGSIDLYSGDVYSFSLSQSFEFAYGVGQSVGWNGTTGVNGFTQEWSRVHRLTDALAGNTGYGMGFGGDGTTIYDLNGNVLWNTGTASGMTSTTGSLIEGYGERLLNKPFITIFDHATQNRLFDLGIMTRPNYWTRGRSLMAFGKKFPFVSSSITLIDMGYNYSLFKNGEMNKGTYMLKQTLNVASLTPIAGDAVGVSSGAFEMVFTNFANTMGSWEYSFKNNPVGTLSRLNQINNLTMPMPSDSTFKNNITQLDDALNIILKMDGVKYYWDTVNYPEYNFNSKEQIGFIAQELEEIAPELVETNIDGKKLVNYYMVIPILVEALKEQQEMIQNQNAMILKLLNEMKLDEEN